MLTLLKKMFLTVIIAMVTVSAQAQTDETRAQGYFDFYTAVLADTSFLPVTYYANSDLIVQARDATLVDVLAPSGLLGTVYRITTTGSPTSFPTAATGRTRLIETATGTMTTLFTTHLTGKISNTEFANVLGTYFRTDASLATNTPIGFTDTDIQTRIDNALDAGAVAPPTPPDTTTLQTQLTTAQAEVMRLTTELSNRPTQAQLNAANAARDAAVAERDARPTQTELDTANMRVAMLEEQIRAGGGTPVAAGGGGGSGAGAAVAVAAVGGALYWWKIRNPTATFTFAAMPIDTDAYTAQLNFAPRENWQVNLEYTESNLFASNDFVKPETNSTAKVTVKYTW